MIHWLHEQVWGPVLLTALLAAGACFTLRSRCFQLRGLPVWWKATAGSLQKREGEEGAAGPHSVTRLQSACTALAATIGTGNIAGVATALAAGGPGAIFWMWVSAFFGMAAAYAETSLALGCRYRSRQGRWICGPVVYLSRQLGMPALGILYGGLCLLASLGMGSMVQANAIAQTLRHSAGIPPEAAALTVSALVFATVSGGAARIGKAAERLIPVSAGLYMAFSLTVLVLCRREILPALGEIFVYAWKPEAAAGGAGGYGLALAFRYGLARGVFSNEAGLGTLAGLHGAAQRTTPEEQGMWAMFEVFFDTVVLCTLTALVILCAAGGARGLAASPWDGAVLASECFRQVLGAPGAGLMSAAMVLFAFATMIAWHFLGRQTLEAVWEQLPLPARRRTRLRRRTGTLYLWLFAAAVFAGSLGSLQEVWELSDVFNGLMAFPNLFALFLLRGQVVFPETRGSGQTKNRNMRRS